MCFQNKASTRKKYAVEIYRTKLAQYQMEIHVICILHCSHAGALLLEYHAFKRHIYENTELSHSDLNTSQFS